MPGPERGGFSEKLKNFNKLTLAGALGIAIAAPYIGYPGLVVPALKAAALDAVSWVGVNQYQKWRSKSSQ